MKSDRNFRTRILFVVLAGAMLALSVCPSMMMASRAVQEKGGRTKTTTAPKAAPRPAPRSTPRQASRATRSPAPTPIPALPSGPAPQIEMVRIEASTFMMGSPDTEMGGSMAEQPQHGVGVLRFHIGKYEVTQAQYMAVMGTNPSNFKGDNLPVENVSWNDAQEFIRRLNMMQKDYIYRLPTEAEWEYACRAGTITPFAFGSSLSSEQANFDGNHPYGDAPKGVNRQKTTPVGSFQPNAWGLYDMHGNVWEWCQSRDMAYPYSEGNGRELIVPWDSGSRMIRGGSWHDEASSLRSAKRASLQADHRNINVGFRLAGYSRNNVIFSP